MTNESDLRRGATSPYFYLGIVFIVLGIVLGISNAIVLAFAAAGVAFIVVAFAGGGTNRKGGSDGTAGPSTGTGA